VWHEACDWYVELIKPDLKGDNGALRKATATTVLVNIMKDALRLIHPFMPFITEEIYSKLPGDGLSILEGRYPENPVSYPQDAAGMELAMEVIRAIRNIRVEMNVAQGAKIEVICFAGTAYAREQLLAGSEYVSRLVKAANFSVATGNERPPDSASSVVAVEGGVIEVFVPLKGLIDLDAEAKKIGKELDAAVAEFTAVEKKLSNESFTAKAPKEVVAKEEARLKTLLEKKAKLESALERLKRLSA
jgi:valyl-tRNA synthetase